MFENVPKLLTIPLIAEHDAGSDCANFNKKCYRADLGLALYYLP